VIALCTVLCGGQGATHMAAFAAAKEPFLRGFLKLEHGIPSHDTFSRLFRLLDPERFRAAFPRFMAKFSEPYQGVIAIDGKVVHRSLDHASGKSPLHMVSAWGCGQRLVLAQIATDVKSNEITAVPKLLEMLTLKGTIVTVDALNCQRDIAQQIVDQGGDYVLALKGNQGTLHDDVVGFLDDPESEVSTVNTTVDGDHGRSRSVNLVGTRTRRHAIGLMPTSQTLTGRIASAFTATSGEGAAAGAGFSVVSSGQTTAPQPSCSRAPQRS